MSSLSMSSLSHQSEPTGFGRENMILERHGDIFAERYLGKVLPIKEVAKLVTAYVVEGKLMDRDGWKQHFGLDIEETDKVKRALDFDRFYHFYHSEISGKQVCELCLIPTIVPKKTKIPGGCEDNFAHCMLEHLPTKHVNKGKHRAMYGYKALGIDKATNSYGNTHLVLTLENPAAIGKDYEEQIQDLKHFGGQKYPCKTDTDSLSVNTVAILHYVVTGFCPFSQTYVHTKERLYAKSEAVVMASGGFSIGRRSTEPTLHVIRSDESIKSRCGVPVVWFLDEILGGDDSLNLSEK